MNTPDLIALGFQVLTGIGLAAAAGLRAFLPALVVGVMGRLGWMPLRPEFAWLASTPILVVLGVAVVVELLGDKVPLLDHALDVAGAVLKPAAGTLVLAAGMTHLGLLPSAVTGLLLGGTVAGAVHLTKSGLRLASTGTTSGLGNPILSVGEDALSLAGSVLAILFPLLLIALLMISLFAFHRIVRWMQRRIPPRPAPRH
jgi:uncharacterized protein DUF4126